MRGLGWSTTVGLLVALVALSGGAIGLTYEEVSSDVGVTFQTAGEVHPDDTDWPSFPAILGSGVCVSDLDGDGFDDLYFANMRYNPQNPATDGWIDDVNATNELYLNDDGTFTDATEGSGLANGAFGLGCSVADVNEDGHRDVYVTNLGKNALYLNTGNGTFENVTGEAGVAGPENCEGPEHPCLSTASAWADYDQDGDLDLFVGNYVDTNLTDEVRGPDNHDAQANWLFRNDGEGTFTEVGEAAGVDGDTSEEGSKTLGAVWFDANDDGYPDLYITNDGTDNEYYRNDGDGTFTERTHRAGLDDDRAGMGVTAQDYDGDADPDLFFTHYNNEANGFYENRNDGTFLDRSAEDEQVESITWVGWGTHFQDLDLDTHPDILLGNGHTEWRGTTYGQPFQAYSQIPQEDPHDPHWANASGTWGLDEIEYKVTRGLATGDLDLDGDVDAVAGNNANQTTQVLEARDADGNALTLELRQSAPNPHAIGAQIAVTVDGETTYRTVRAGSSYLSQSSLKATFGLGQASLADEVTIRWPDGETSTFTDVDASRILRVDRATGQLVHDTLAPDTELSVDGTAGENGWWTSPVTVTVDATDRGIEATSGVAETEIALGDGDWRTDASLSLDEGEHTVHHRATDETGNEAPRATTSVQVDTQPPTADHRLEGTLGQAGWYVEEPVDVVLEGEDATSGVDRLEYRRGDGDWQTYEGSVTIEDDGVHEITYRAIDEAGLVSAEHTITVRLDRTPPDLETVSPRPGDIYVADQHVASAPLGPVTVLVPPAIQGPDHEPLTVEATARDATSGLDHVQALAGSQPLDEPRTSEPFAWPWAVHEEPQGSHQLTVQARDVAGNQAEVHLPVTITSATSASLQATADQGPSIYAPTWIPGLASPGELAGAGS